MLHLSPESEIIEYKETLAEINEAGETICGFLNQKGGSLYFGVENSGKVLGLKIGNKTIIDITQAIFDNIRPECSFNISPETIDEKEIIKISVNRSQIPYHTFKRRPFIRIANMTKPMPQDEYQLRLKKYQNVEIDYSSTLVENANLTDLDNNAITELRRLLKQSGRYLIDIDSENDKQLLKNLLLIRDSKITVAALILLGTEQSLSKFLPFAEIRYGFKLNQQEIRNRDMAIYKGGYLLLYNKIWEKIDGHNLSLSIPIGMRLVEKKSFDEQTIREAVNNAVVHRDYYSQESCFILQTPDQIQVKSPGGLPDGITVENIINETKPRNKFLADILFKCEMVEQFGTGVNLMYQSQLSLGKNPPDYSKTTKDRVILNLDGSVHDIEFAKYVIKVAESKNIILNDEQLILLNKIKNGQKISDTNTVLQLFDSGLIEKSGYNRYMLSKQYYVDTNQKASYTKKKGITKNVQKELILQHLRNFDGGKKSDFAELFGYELNGTQIDWLLASLKKDGLIYFEGKQRSPKGLWKLKITSR